MANDIWLTLYVLAGHLYGFFEEVIYPDLLSTLQSGLGQQAASEGTGAFCQALGPEFSPHNTRSGKKQTTPTSCLLPSHMYHDMDAHTMLILNF